VRRLLGWPDKKALAITGLGLLLLGAYAVVLLGFTFFARFFNDSYVGVVITLGLCAIPLGSALLRVPVIASSDRLAA